MSRPQSVLVIRVSPRPLDHDEAQRFIDGHEAQLRLIYPGAVFFLSQREPRRDEIPHVEIRVVPPCEGCDVCREAVCGAPPMCALAALAREVAVQP